MNNNKNTNTDGFYQYYEEYSQSEASIERFKGIKSAVEVVLKDTHKSLTKGLNVADIGCNAGIQMLMWARDNYNVYGIDINKELVDLAKNRAEDESLDVIASVGSADSLPWSDSTMDVCLLPELLEHVVDWESCVNESVRVLKPGGVLYISTTNILCPKQQEFDLPLYSWYPGFLKRYYEKLSVTTRPELVSHAKYPAVHWFSYYKLRGFLRPYGFTCMDRFDVLKRKTDGGIKSILVNLITKCSPLRLVAHMFTSYTLIIAIKNKS